MENESAPKRKNIDEVIKNYKKVTGQPESESRISSKVVTDTLPHMTNFNQQEFERQMSRETDPDLMTSYEIIQLPSKGLFYSNHLSEVSVEYMTSKDEDLLTTPSLIDSGNILNLLLKRKIKTPNVNPDELLGGDRNAIILFLRTSSYGSDYSVQVPDPRTGISFKASVNLLQLKYKDFKEMPDEYGHFSVEIPMRKKIVKFRLLNSGEENIVFKKSEAIRSEMNAEYSEYSTMKLKAHIVAINEKTDRSYIDKFIDAMPALDAFTIRKKILEVAPDVDMTYEFTAKDGYKFAANLTIGVDFFFPSI